MFTMSSPVTNRGYGYIHVSTQYLITMNATTP